MSYPDSPYQLYACLPFIELGPGTHISLGPVEIWPASQFQQKLDSAHHALFEEYIESIGRIQTPIEGQENKFVDSIKLTPEKITCLSLASDIPKNQKDILLIDALYLLYFVCNFRALYYGYEIASFDAFRKVIPASMSFIEYRQNWQDLHIPEIRREQTVNLHLLDQEMCGGLGKILQAIYQTNDSSDETKINAYKRLIRSIRYLVDCFFQRFVNLLGKGIYFSEELFEPEDIIFLTSSFEALLNLDDKQTTADFKQKVRPMLYLKHAGPLEIFWKWVDDFYEARQKIVHGGPTPDPFFRINPNFEVSHMTIGIKLFVYTLYYTLYQHRLIHAAHGDPSIPPDFKWIHPEEILLFFWPESNLIRRLNQAIERALTGEQEEFYADTLLLANLFVMLYERYIDLPERIDIRFIPFSTPELKAQLEHILEMVDEEQKNHPDSRLFSVLPPGFAVYIGKRSQLIN